MSSSTPTLKADDHQALTTLLAAIPDNMAAVSLPDCNTYKTYRPILQTALPFVAKIPIYGSKIAAALTFLLSLADSVCNIQPSLQQAAAGGQGVTVQKVSDNEVTVTLPAGQTINSDHVTASELYVALGRSLNVQGSVPPSADCIGVLGPICLID